MHFFFLVGVCISLACLGGPFSLTSGSIIKIRRALIYTVLCTSDS